MYKTYKNGKKNNGVTFAMFIQSFSCVIISGFILLFTGGLGQVFKNMLFNKVALISPIFIFLGMFFTNLGLRYEVNYLLFTMIKSSKCLAVMLLTYFFPTVQGKSSIKRKELMYAIIITAGLVVFNMSVKIIFKELGC